MCLKCSAIVKGTEALTIRTTTINQFALLMQQALEWANSSERDGDIRQLGEWTLRTQITDMGYNNVTHYTLIIDTPDNHSATLLKQMYNVPDAKLPTRVLFVLRE